MKIATIIIRSLLGLLFLAAGANTILNFRPLPPFTGEAAQFMEAMIATHFVFVVALFEVVGGSLLLTRRYPPLGLTLVGPVAINIVAFHSFMAPEGLPAAFVVSALSLFLLWSYRSHFSGLIKPVSSPKRSNDIQPLNAD